KLSPQIEAVTEMTKSAFTELQSELETAAKKAKSIRKTITKDDRAALLLAVMITWVVTCTASMAGPALVKHFTIPTLKEYAEESMPAPEPEPVHKRKRR
ncbi:MAG: hypothetical protein ACRC9V_03295, partial [Aeromonas sp.]